MKNSRYVVIGLSLFCAILIAVTSVNSSFLMPLRSGAGFFLVPLERGVNRVGGGLWNGIRSYSTLRSAQEENQRLSQRLDALTEENNRLSGQVTELSRLRELYQLDQSYMDYPKVAARVIARDSGNWFHIFRIDKGTADGIYPEMNVMAGGGLIGIVTDAGRHYATVRSIIDDSSNVSGMSQRSGAGCNVAGSMTLYEDNRLGLDHIRKEADIQEGDKIVTSNISDIFLPGILIGYASDLQTDANNVTKSGTIIPVGKFDNLQEVLIITRRKKDLTADTAEGGEGAPAPASAIQDTAALDSAPDSSAGAEESSAANGGEETSDTADNAESGDQT